MSSEPIHPLISMIRRLNRRLVDWIDVPISVDADAAPTAGAEEAAPSTQQGVCIKVESTPNPNAMKYLLRDPQTPRTLAPGSEANDPFAGLLGLDGVRSVFVMESFLTVLKSPDMSWEVLAPKVVAALEASDT